MSGYGDPRTCRTSACPPRDCRRKIEDDPGNPGIIQTMLGGGYRLGLASDD
jgi:DNA-binding response OmpR family regulator